MVTAEEEAELKGYIEEHVKHTGSVVGQRVLDDWSNAKAQFVKVMPTDYRRAMEEAKQGTYDASADENQVCSTTTRTPPEGSHGRTDDLCCCWCGNRWRSRIEIERRSGGWAMESPTP